MKVLEALASSAVWKWGLRHQTWLLALTLFLMAFALAVQGASVRAVTDFEAPRLQLVERLEPAVLGVAELGPGQLLTPETKALCTSVPGESATLGLLAAWAKLSIARVGMLSDIASVRLPFIVLTSLVPALLFLLLQQGVGLRLALLAALVILAAPIWRTASAVATPGAIAASVWLLVLTPYVASLMKQRRRVCWSLVAAVAFGIGMSFSAAAFWSLPLIALHYLILRAQEARRLALGGHLPAPATLVFSVALGPVFTILLNPAHWGASATAIARIWLVPLNAPEVVAESAPLALLGWTPPFLLLCALAGGALLLAKAAREKFLNGYVNATEPRRVVTTLMVLGAAVASVGPLLLPAVLASSKPHFELALPFLAALAALAVFVLARHAKGGRFEPWIELAALALMFVGR